MNMCSHILYAIKEVEGSHTLRTSIEIELVMISLSIYNERDLKSSSVDHVLVSGVGENSGKRFFRSIIILFSVVVGFIMYYKLHDIAFHFHPLGKVAFSLSLTSY